DSYTHTILAVEGNSFTDQDVFNSGTTRQGKWNCDNGNLTALDLPGGASASVSTQGSGTTDFQTTNSSGITLPAIINPGDVWLQSLTLEGTQAANGVSYQVSNNFNNDCKAVGVESVTVQAGIFDAMRVDCNTTMKISLTLGDTPMENTFNLTGTSWYAQGVGMVKSATSGMGLDSTIELVSYNIP
ncbi:MAG TPA: hypothetical protein VHP14_24720, partial [Anaerolineales bacterium]|nr:hypothetical protein [Anaerolineales bacterium]